MLILFGGQHTWVFVFELLPIYKYTISAPEGTQADTFPNN